MEEPHPLPNADPAARIEALEAELADARRQQAATAATLISIGRSPANLQDVLDTLVASTATLCQAEDVSIHRIDGDTVRYAAHCGPIPLPSRSGYSLDANSPPARSMRERRRIEVADLPAETGEYPLASATARSTGARTFLCVPLLRDDAAIGAFVLRRTEVRAFSASQIALVESFASQAVIAIENARLFEAEQARTREVEGKSAELAQSLDRQTALSEVLAVISRTPGDIQAVFNTIVLTACRLCDADRVSMWLIDGEEFRPVAYGGREGLRIGDSKDMRLPLGDGSLPGRAAKAGKPLHLLEPSRDETLSEPARKALDMGAVKTYLTVPLMRQGQPFGAITLTRRIVQSFTEDQIALVETFADQAVIAIENARLFEAEQARTREVEAKSAELTESLEYQTAMSDVLGVISRSPTDIQPVLETIAANATRLCGAQWSRVTRFDGEIITLGALHNISDAADVEIIRKSYPRKLTQSGVGDQVLLKRRVIYRSDTLSDTSYEFIATARALGTRSLLAVPMLRDGEPVGAIAVAGAIPNAFTERQIKLLESFANQAVIAINNVGLFEEVQARTKELTESLEYQTALAEVLQVISRSSGQAQTALDEIAETAKRLCEADKAIIWQDVGDSYTAAAFAGVRPERVEPLRAHRIKKDRGSTAGRAIADRTIVHTPDVLADPDFASQHEFNREAGTRTMLSVPLLAEGGALGSLTLVRSRVQPFTDKQIDLVKTFADQAVIAIENARLLDELQRRQRELTESLEYQTAISDVLDTISRSRSEVQPVLDEIVQTAARLGEADVVAMRRRIDGEFRTVADHNYSQEQRAWFVKNFTPPPPQSAMGRAIAERRTIHAPDAYSDPALASTEAAQNLSTRSLLVVPLQRGDDLIGTLFLGRRVQRPFTNRQIALIETFADQAVIAIENARLLEELQTRQRELEARSMQLAESLEYQTAAGNVLGIIARAPADLQPVLNSVVQTSARLCRADNAILYRLRDGTLQFAAGHGHDPALIEIVRNLSHGLDDDTIVGRAARDKRAVEISDTQADTSYRLKELCERYGVRSLIGIPLMRLGVPIGAIALARTHVEPFTPREIEIVTTFADQAVIAIENARLLDELQTRQRELEARSAELAQSLEYQTATSEVLAVISRSPDKLQPVLDAIAATAGALCDADYTGFFMQDGDVFHIVANDKVAGEFLDYVKANPVPRSRGSAVGRAALVMCTVHIHDVLVDPEYALSENQRVGGSRTHLAVPLIKGGAVVGVISLIRKTVRPFSARQIELVNTFANQAVIAINNVGLFEQVQARTRELTESLEYQTATSEVLSVISRSPNALQPVLNAIVKTAANLCEAEYSIFFSMQAGELVPTAGKNADDAVMTYFKEQPLAPSRGSTIGRAAMEQRTVHLPDILADADFQTFDRQKVSDMRTGLAVPLIKDGRPIAVIFLGRKAVRPFSDRQVDLVTTFADQALIAINNVGLFEQVQARSKELAQSVEELRSLGEVGRSVSSSLDARHVLQTVLEHACRISFTGGGTIYVFDKASGEFRLEAGHNMSEEHIERVRAAPMRVGDPVVGECAERREAVQVEDIATIDRARSPLIDILLRAGVRAILAVPLLHQGEVIGALVVRRNFTGAFSPETVRLLEAFASQSAIAVRNARLFEEVQARTREVQEALEYQTATSEVLGVISRSPNELQPVLDSIVTIAARLCEAEFATLFTVAGDKCLVVASNNADSEFVRYLRESPPALVPGSPTGRAALFGETVHIPDLLEWVEYTRRDAQKIGQQRTILSIPLLRDMKAVGVISLMRTAVRPFSERQIKLVETFADQAVIAINNARLFREIEEKGEQLRLASQHKSQFLANMSHELRTPLNAILGYTELMQDGIYGALPEKAAGVLDRVQSNGRHLLGLINSVLDLSKIEAGQLKLSLAEYSIGGIVETVMVATESLATEKKLKLASEVAPDLPRGVGDEQRIVQVLLNLVGNAIKFTETGEVRIHAGLFAGRFQIAVADTGPGIPQAELGRIFEEFHQVDSSNTKVKGGTGLGLAIAKRIVELHGGRIWVESAPAKGATFRFELPVVATLRENDHDETHTRH